MNLLEIAFETLVVVAGGLFLAAVAAWPFWTMFKAIRYPEAGPIVAVVAVAGAFHDRLGNSPLIQMTILFGVLIAALGTIEGSLWRAAHPPHR